MEKYLNYIELNEDYNPAQTFKSYVTTNFNKEEIDIKMAGIKKSFIERFLQQPINTEIGNKTDVSNINSLDIIGAIYVYVKDYDPSENYIKFLASFINVDNNSLPNSVEELSEEGQYIYRLLQLIGENVFYELLVQELEVIDVINQDEIQVDPYKSEIDGMSKRKAQTFLYNVCVPVTKGRWKDESWQGVHRFFKELEKYNIPSDLKDAKYHNYPYEQTMNALPYKEWIFEIPFIDDKNKQNIFYCTIRASGAGSVADPLDVYDVTVVIT